MKSAFALLAVLMLAPLSSVAERAASAFTLKDISGKKFDLGTHLGKDVVVLNFFATWCAPCMAEMPALQAIQDRHADGLKVILVSIDDPKSAAKVKPLIREQKITTTVLLDTETKVVSLYNPKKAVPFTVVIDRSGNVVSEHAGYQAGDDVKLEKQLVALLGGDKTATEEPPTPAP